MTEEEKIYVLLIASRLKIAWINFQLFMLSWGFIPMGILLMLGVGHMYYSTLTNLHSTNIFLLVIKAFILCVAWILYLEHAKFKLYCLWETRREHKEFEKERKT